MPSTGTIGRRDIGARALALDVVLHITPHTRHGMGQWRVISTQ